MDTELLTADVMRLLDTRMDQSQTEKVASLLVTGSPALVAAEADVELAGNLDSYLDHLDHLQSRGFRAINILDKRYPQLLREVREAPAVVFTEGSLEPDEVGVSIVGSRDASSEALHASHQLAASLAALGVPIISGLARGIDSAAHLGALEAGGRTVAVVASGLDRTYPPEHLELRKRIVDQDGLILSQFRLGSNLHRRNFPMRNALMSGYGSATVVMAAGEKSGTRHQVEAAVKHGRPVLFTGKVAKEVSWARGIMDRGQGMTVHSLENAVEAVLETRKLRTAELSLF